MYFTSHWDIEQIMIQNYAMARPKTMSLMCGKIKRAVALKKIHYGQETHYH